MAGDLSPSKATFKQLSARTGNGTSCLPGGSTGGGDYFVCSLVDYVEIVTETDATPWPEYLAKVFPFHRFLSATDQDGEPAG